MGRIHADSFDPSAYGFEPGRWSRVLVRVLQSMYPWGFELQPAVSIGRIHAYKLEYCRAGNQIERQLNLLTLGKIRCRTAALLAER